ncbi:MAG: putative rRNA maturation factor [Parcubacteria group bacterium GW2011_GWC1_43_11b]|uniref:Endoribonuclease YbeY n=2 Tax=Candidatus Vogeliibacteriota TaxID=1817922 RepID=A0A1G2QC78_9BACT|nr:MAG: putative rRNA maturation factor [Parcubacteria group bacterium GW2011_GWC1_43_11b]KKT09879.1 MAG: putative rRNA maturation factor [Parcubacteria group bacterium GW2011_GWA1_43_21]OHA58174.1 MAG: rRNA maturation RNase YbeY [Candidatus Vogelbacteria bacterium RIFOXYB1_FULL_42_16]OHA59201.1 MAG: rRNA maturation RNase YbeY [Candidatus Vogelbacteria bacterium RIFOXYD1_FULL_42_15]
MFSIVNRLKQKRVPKLPFASIADKILGPKYELGLVFVEPAEIQTINKKYRHHDYPTNVLSFPLTEKEGEILINLVRAKEEAPDFDHDFKNHLLFLFIHGCLHLKGLRHSSIMVKEEKRFFQLFRINVTPNHHRSGYRHGLTPSRRVRI